MVAMTFSHIAITCKDPLVIEQFYSKHFGFRRARVVSLGEDQIVFLKRENVYLEIFHATSEAPLPAAAGSGPEYPGWRHLAFTVDDVDAKVAEMGIKQINEKKYTEIFKKLGIKESLKIGIGFCGKVFDLCASREFLS